MVYHRGPWAWLKTVRSAAHDPALIFTVKTDNVGTSNDDQFTLPLLAGKTYSCDIDWGDDTSTHQINDTSPTHTYAAGAGTYTISIIGTCPSIYFNNGGDKLKFLSLQNWGDVVWAEIMKSFFGCANYISSATDAGYAQITATDYTESWYGCTSMESFPDDIDLSSGESFTSTWRSTALTSFPALDLSSGTSFNLTWYTSASMTSFGNCDLSSGESFGSTWRATGLTSFPALDLSAGTVFASAWQDTDLTSFPSGIDLSAGENFTSTWQGCTALGGYAFPLLNLRSMTNGTSCFSGWAMATASWDAYLIDLEANNPNNSVTFSGGNSTYTETAVDSGTTTSTTADKLVQTGQNFDVTITIGDIVHNTTDDTYADVTAVDSATTLSLGADIMASGETFIIQSSAAAKARYALVDSQSWTITDGGPV